jgi:hypothetical protein
MKKNDFLMMPSFTEVYKVNKDNGFWDKKRNLWEILSLIDSERIELLEAHRKNKLANTLLFKQELSKLDNSISTLSESSKVDIYKELFEATVKDTIQGEMTDMLIRIWDFFGGLMAKGIRVSSMPEKKYPIPKDVVEKEFNRVVFMENIISVFIQLGRYDYGEYMKIGKASLNFGERLYILKDIMPSYKSGFMDLVTNLALVTKAVIKFYKEFPSDLTIAEYMRYGLRYNSYRGKKHGKKY